MKKKKLLIPVIASIITVLILSGVSYAFYSARIKENNKTETVIKTNELTIKYTGTQEINVDNIVPGDSMTKTFTVENTSNVPVTYNIYLENITNEFNEDLVYTLKEENNEIIKEEVLPISSDKKSYLITDVEIKSQEVKQYEMTVEFKYSDKDQNKLQGKKFNATLGIDTTPIKIVKVVNEKIDIDKLNSGEEVTKTFNVKNLSSTNQNYDIKLSEIVNTYGNNLTYTLSKNGQKVKENEPMPTTDTKILENQTINGKTTDNYEITIKYEGTTASLDFLIADGNDKFSAKISVNNEESSIYKEALLNGTDPVLSDNLIPVVLSNDGTVTKADIKEQWYKYEDKKWANAVILADNTKTYNNGDTIPEDNIESYFVWIPKYSYQIFNLGTTDGYTSGKPTTSNAKEIQIKFGTKNTNDSNNGECTTPMTSGASGNCKVGDYMTSPAFISMNTNGLWVAKFETTGSTSNVTVKPNQTSLRNINVKTMFETAYNYKRDNDSHMMKNTEWGAVAYLSHSKYGINTEVRINNNSSMLTGYAATDNADETKFPGTYGTDSSVTLPYNTSTGYKASTTGNITGIYDMSGGSQEYMASLRNETYGSSGFAASTLKMYNSKYYDLYDGASNETSYSKRILGDATGEMGPFYYYKDTDNNSRAHNSWYADVSSLLSTSSPCLHRGGGYRNGVLAGQLAFTIDTGGALKTFSFRLVLIK